MAASLPHTGDRLHVLSENMGMVIYDTASDRHRIRVPHERTRPGALGIM